MQVGGYGGEGHKMLTANSEEMFKVLSLHTFLQCNVTLERENNDETTVTNELWMTDTLVYIMIFSAKFGIFGNFRKNRSFRGISSLFYQKMK